jgi:hypothetical protein
MSWAKGKRRRDGIRRTTIMPRRNRVTPSGAIVSIAQRGTFFGNRGILHDERGVIRREWQVRRWLVCLLEFHGRHRTVMTPNRYTELFFLDEATALAAGHRPCFECRRARFLAFRDAWARGNLPGIAAETVRVRQIDDLLHADRLGPERSKRTFRSTLGDLPDGVFVTLAGSNGTFYLIWPGKLLVWSIEGYRDGRSLDVGEVVTVLTPRSTVAAIRAGYRPEVHPSAVF